MKSHPQTVAPKRARNVSQIAGSKMKFPPPAIGNGEAKASTPMSVDPARRHRLVAEAAYYRAARRGFTAGGELKDWLDAEAEIKQLLGQ